MDLPTPSLILWRWIVIRNCSNSSSGLETGSGVEQTVEEAQPDEELAAADADNVVALRQESQGDDGAGVDRIVEGNDQATGMRTDEKIRVDDIPAELMGDLDAAITTGRPVSPPISDVPAKRHETADIKLSAGRPAIDYRPARPHMSI